MSSRPLPSTTRPSSSQFISDLVQVLRRHKVPFGHPSDIEHLSSDLESNPSFRGDLFSLCTAISHMSEHDLSAPELLELVARAITGFRTPGHVLEIPATAATVFVREYEAWSARLDAPEQAGSDTDPEETDAVWRAPDHPYSAAASLAGPPEAVRRNQARSEPLPDPAPKVSPATPIGDLTLGELKGYLDDIEQRVSRLQPYLDAVTRGKPADHDGPASGAEHGHAQGHSPAPIPFPNHAGLPSPARPASVKPKPAAPERGRAELVPPPPVHVSPPAPDNPHFDTYFQTGSLERHIAPHRQPQVRPDPPLPITGEPVFAARPAPVHINSFGRVPSEQDPSAPRNWMSPRALIAAAAAAAALATAAFLGLRNLNEPAASTPERTVTLAQPAEPAPAPFAQDAKATAPHAAAGRQTASQKPSTATPKTASDLRPAPRAELTSSAGLEAAVRPLVNSDSVAPPSAVSSPTSGQAIPTIPSGQSASSVVRAPGAGESPVTQPQAASPPAPGSVQPQSLSSGGTTPQQRTTIASAAGPNPNAPAVNAAPIVRMPDQPLSVSSATLMKYAVSTPQPSYPSFHKTLVDDSVLVQATIGKDGKVSAVRALSGSADLQTAAVQAMQRWRFRPYVVDGVPTQVVTNLRFVFKATR